VTHRPSVHARCHAVDTIDGRTVICGKSKGHDHEGAPIRLSEHYDPSANIRWPSTRRHTKEPR